MKRDKWERVAEPSEGLVHFKCVGRVADGATICGKTDWIGCPGDGADTDEDVNCAACRDLLRAIKATGWPREVR